MGGFRLGEAPIYHYQGVVTTPGLNHLSVTNDLSFDATTYLHVHYQSAIFSGLCMLWTYWVYSLVVYIPRCQSETRRDPGPHELQKIQLCVTLVVTLFGSIKGERVGLFLRHNLSQQ